MPYKPPDDKFMQTMIASSLAVLLKLATDKTVEYRYHLYIPHLLERDGGPNSEGLIYDSSYS